MSISRILSVAAVLVAAPLALSAQGKVDLGGAKLADLETKAKSDSNNPLNHYYLALAYWNEKRWADVKKELNTALVLDSRYAAAHMTLAALPFATRKSLWGETINGTGVPSGGQADLDESDLHYKLAYFNDPNVDIAILGTVASVSDGTDFGKGVVACHQARYTDCHSLMTQYFTSRRGNSSRIVKAAYWYDAVGSVHAKDYASASGAWGFLSNRKEDDTRQLVSSDVARIPLNTSDIDFVIGVVSYKLANNPGEALPVFQRAVNESPNNYLAHVYLANLYDTQRNFEKAISEREAAMKVNTTDPRLHLELGLTLAKASKLPDAVKHIEAATQLMPRSAQAWYSLGLVKDASGDKAGAKDAYAKAIANASTLETGIVNNAKTKMGGH